MPTSAETIHCNQCGLPSASDAGFCQRCGTKLAASAHQSALHQARPHHAGFWIRVIAALIDSILLFVVLHLYTMLVGSFITVAGLHNGLSTAKIFAMRRSMRFLVGFFLGGFYRVGMES